MAMARLLFLMVVLAAAGSCSASELNIRMPTSGAVAEAAERLQDGAGHLIHDADLPCDSWRLGVEAHNVRGWRTVPANCKDYVKSYMFGRQYWQDSKVVVDEAVAYAEGLKLGGKGKEVWVFDIDGTSLSSLQYYAMNGFGATPYSETSFNEYADYGIAPELPDTLRLYRKLLSLGVKPVFLTERAEKLGAITILNLQRQGYSDWMMLLLKPDGLKASVLEYKSGLRKKLQKAGYVIVGNIGNQWSDILGAPEGARTFKLPDPVYYIV